MRLKRDQLGSSGKIADRLFDMIEESIQASNDGYLAKRAPWADWVIITFLVFGGGLSLWLNMP
jgi:hypothetical protein